MTTVKPVLLFFLLLSPLVTLSQMLTPAQLQEDLTHFQTALNEAHPAPYRYTSKAQFDSLVAAIVSRLNRPMTQHEFYVTMTPLLVALRDGHIKWLLPGQDEHYPFSTDKLFPVKLFFSADKAWIISHYGAYTLPAGAEVLTINNEPIATIIRKLLPNMTFADGYTTGSKYQDLNQFFSGYYATYIGAPPTHQVTYRVGDSTRTVQLPALSLAAIGAYNDFHKPGQQPAYSIALRIASTPLP